MILLQWQKWAEETLWGTSFLRAEMGVPDFEKWVRVRVRVIARAGPLLCGSDCGCRELHLI